MALRVLDAVLTEDLPGVLVVGVCRDREVDAAHPLTSMIRRWGRLGVAPRELRLENLAQTDVATVLAQMLRIPGTQADELAAVLGERAAGNPDDTVELVNALRREGALTLAPEGWTWDARTIRHFVGTGDVVDLLKSRIDRLPEHSRRLLYAISCLGDEVTVELLSIACALTPDAVTAQLLPAVEDGLLVVADRAPGPFARQVAGIRFRHDRVQQAGHDALTDTERADLRLSLARRLDAGQAREAESAEQYLHVVDQLLAAGPGDEPVRAAELLRTAATRARATGNTVLVERNLAAATALYTGTGVAADSPALLGLDSDRHSALYALGRMDDADRLYAGVELRCRDPLDLVPAACVQIASLTNRGRPFEALALGMDLLGRLGFTDPHEHVETAVDVGFARIESWLTEVSVDDDVRRPEVSDARAQAAAALLSRMSPPAFFADHERLAWMVITAQSLWRRYGPQSHLVFCLCHANTIGPRLDYRLARRIVLRVLEVGRARGYDAMTAQGHFLHSVSSAHWFEPLERGVAEAQAARETILQAGDLQTAGFAFYPSITGLLDCGQTLEACANETAAGLALSARTGNEQTGGSMVAYRQLVRALRGETAAVASFSDGDFEEEQHLAAAGPSNPMAVVYFHLLRALSAALYDDPQGLASHTEQAWPLLRFIGGTYSTALAHVLRGLTLARQVRAARVGDREGMLAELDLHITTLHGWTADAPENFTHLLRLVEAERAWATGDALTAMRAFDQALRAADGVCRPWHHAFIAERSGRWHRDLGIERTGLALLAEARARYLDWGADGKVRALDAEFPGLAARTSPARDAQPSATSSMSVTSDAIDMTAILLASQALGSQTDPDRLRAVIDDQLQSLTGATAVGLVLRDPESGAWTLESDGRRPASLPVDEAGANGLLPLTVFRYCERTGQPVVVGDVARDERFAHDPYLQGRERYSLLAVPILSGGLPRAVLLLENSANAKAFSTDRLDAVQLIAGQLAISLDNSQLYRSLEAKVTRRTRELESAMEQLEALSITDALTSVANRRRFDDALAAEWAEGAAARLNVAVLMIDIDHFKHYNDAFGHIAGDECIRAVAAALTSSMRESDLVCRYGGEEFAVILPRAGVGQATTAAQRAREAVRALDIPHPDERGRVPVSIGVAAMVPAHGVDAQALVAQADAALYRAKLAGRDRVTGPQEGEAG
jgi:diguanylate cyclase (GGDEF)-like protein